METKDDTYEECRDMTGSLCLHSSCEGTYGCEDRWRSLNLLECDICKSCLPRFMTKKGLITTAAFLNEETI